MLHGFGQGASALLFEMARCQSRLQLESSAPTEYAS